MGFRTGLRGGVLVVLLGLARLAEAEHGALALLFTADESRMSVASLHYSSRSLLRKDPQPAPSLLQYVHVLAHAVP